LDGTDVEVEEVDESPLLAATVAEGSEPQAVATTAIAPTASPRTRRPRRI